MITEKLKHELIATAKKEYPLEMCGVLLKQDDEIIFQQCENISEQPTELFELDSTVLLSDKVVAIVHSHTNGRNYLSKWDMANQQLTDLAWVLVCGDSVNVYRPIPPLLGREFVFNLQDCYNLFRDCYMVAGVDLPVFTYSPDWYKQGQNLYVEELKAHGFEQVNTLEVGDVILFTIGSTIANHAGIYLGEELFIHHLINRLSKRDVYGGYWLQNTHSIWRYKWKSQLNFTAIYENLAMSSNW